MNFIKKFISPILLLILAYVTHSVWFSPASVISFSDWYYWPSNAVKEMWNSWISWNGYFNLGSPNVQLPFFGFTSIWSFIVSIGGTFDIATKFTFFIPIAVLGFLSPYFLVNFITKNRLISFVSAIFYASSTYFLIQQSGEPPIALVYALAPLIYLQFIYTLRNNLLKNWFILILIYEVGILYEVRIMCILTSILSLHFIFYHINDIRRYYKQLFVFGFIILLLNLFWILPIFSGISHQISQITNRELFGGTLSNILYAVTTSHWSWTGAHPNETFTPQNISWYFWLIPLLIFSFLLLQKKGSKKNLAFFLFLSLFGILLTKQSAIPFVTFYEFLYKHIPGFNLFREASKFYLIIQVGYLGMLAYGLLDLKKNKRKLAVVYMIVILFVSCINFIPLISGSIGTLFVNRIIPDDYKKIDKSILNGDIYFRTLWIPVYSRWSFFDNKHPEINTADTIQSEWIDIARNMVKSKDDNIGKKIVTFISAKPTKNLLDDSSIKYVIVPLEDKANDDYFFPNYGEPRQYYINELNKISWLKRIDIGTKEIAVYENPSYRPHIYTTQEKETITKEVPYQKIQFGSVNSTQYTLRLDNIKKPLYVNFSESYNPNWKMHVGDFSWFQVLTDKNYFLPSKWHFQNDATLNSFYIDPAVACSSSYSTNGCVKNSDGTYTIHATLYFTPQSYMYLGLIISGATLAGILGYLSFVGVVFLRRKYARHS